MLLEQVLASVYFYNQVVTVNIKINDVVSDILLAIYIDGKTFQKKMP